MQTFYALGDLSGADNAVGMDTNLDFEVLFDENRISSTAGTAFSNHYQEWEIPGNYLQTAPVQSVKFFNASNTREDWGFSSVTAGANIPGPHFGKAGIGDCLEIPVADLTWGGNAGDLLSLKHFALATLPDTVLTDTFSTAKIRYATIYFNDIGTSLAVGATANAPTAVRVDLRHAKLSMRQSGNNRADPFVMHTEFVAPLRINAAGTELEAFTQAHFAAIAAACNSG